MRNTITREQQSDHRAWVHPATIPRRYYAPSAGIPAPGTVPVRSDWESRQPIENNDGNDE